MNIKPIICNYNINRKMAPSLVCFSHADNVRTRYILLKLFEGKEPLSVSGSVVSASIVSAKEKCLIVDNLVCEVTQDGDILVPIDVSDSNYRKGSLKIEVRVEKDNRVFTLPFPLWVKINGSVLDTAEVNESSAGTVPTLLAQSLAQLERVSALENGKSSYEIAVENGFAGNEAEWLNSLKNPLDYSVIRNEIEQVAENCEEAVSSLYSKSEIDAMFANVGQNSVVSSVAEMTNTTKCYVLESTGHVWAYRSRTETVTQSSGNLMTVNASKLNLRISGTNTAGTSGAGCFIAEPIPVDLSSVPTGGSLNIYFKGFGSNMGTLGSANYSNSKILLLDEEMMVLEWKYIAAGSSTANQWLCSVSGDDCVGDIMTILSCRNIATADIDPADVKYLLISPQIAPTGTTISSSDLEGLSIEFEPVTVTQVVSAWEDTGVNYNNGNEQVFIDLEDRVTALENREQQTAEQDAGYPAYWQNEIDDTVNKIKAVQNQGGHSILCFGWCSDMHIHPTGCDKEKYIGAVADEIMRQCNIPLFLMTGDMFSNSPNWTKEQTYTAYEKAWEYLEPIPGDKLLLIKGNHDAWYGSKDGQYYVDGLCPNELYQKMFSPQSCDSKRVFGGDGSYFYLDHQPMKTRFICLNSQWADFTRDNVTDLPLYNTQKHAGIGQQQFDWLIDALDVPVDYGVVICLHTPPTDNLTDGRRYLTGENNRDLFILRAILDAYSNKTEYSGSFTHSRNTLYGAEGAWADVEVDCDFSGYNGTLYGVFCGHSHYDQHTVNDISAPVVCITSACDSPYDSSASLRVLETKDETAFDFVCIDRDTGRIDLVRCGCGQDRVIYTA